MTAAAGDALQLALGLYRAPSHRFAARERPLPADIGEVLYLATGARSAVAAAMDATGESEEVLIEASRFYLQQVLFGPDADAYRVLGAELDAPTSQLRDHHRWLQRWLHPDRRNGEWEAIFASRVNAAWAQVRTLEARRRYDANRAGASGAPSAMTATASGRIWVPDIEHPRLDRSRLLALAALGGCLVLVVLLARRQDRPPDWSVDANAGPAKTQAPDPIPVPARRASQSGTTPASVVMAPDRASRAGHASSPATRRPPPRDILATTPPATTPPTPPTMARAPTTRAQALLPTAASLAAPPAALPQPPPARRRAGPPPQARIATASRDRNPLLPAAPALAPASAAETTRLAQPAVPADSTLPADPVQRMRLARDCTRRVVRYLGDPSARTPPIWNDLRTQQRAERHQQALQARLGRAGRIALELQDAQWRLGDDESSLRAVYRVVGRQGVAETGVLKLGLTWRARSWLVREISLEPST